jgi:hypothetical protein
MCVVDALLIAAVPHLVSTACVPAVPTEQNLCPGAFGASWPAADELVYMDIKVSLLSGSHVNIAASVYTSFSATRQIKDMTLSR